MQEVSVNTKRIIRLARANTLVLLCLAFALVVFGFFQSRPIFLSFTWIIFVVRSLVFLVLISATKSDRLNSRFDLETVLFIAFGIQGFLIYISGETFHSIEIFLGTLFLVAWFNVVFKNYLLFRFSRI